jgi:NAD(P)-dependent dehydrogenase (short-subunit alcohol dehydrogenase family)
MNQPPDTPNPTAARRTALVTGSSSGIGRATAQRLHRAGYVVHASARRPDTLADLAGEGIHSLALDVTDEASMRAAVDRIIAERGQVDVLVNAAGFELVGAVEEIPPAEVRRQFDTNVFGPGFAYYAATKHAVEAFSDALRLEVAGFGIRVVQVEPTAAHTGLAANATWAGEPSDGPYARFHKELERWHTETFACDRLTRRSRRWCGRCSWLGGWVGWLVSRGGHPGARLVSPGRRALSRRRRRPRCLRRSARAGRPRLR